MVSENAEVRGDVYAEVATIAGFVEGEVRAGEASIQETGRVFGNTVTSQLATSKGAFIDGKIIMDGEEGEMTGNNASDTFPTEEDNSEDDSTED